MSGLPQKKPEYKSEFGGLGIKILLDHEGHFEYYGVIKLPEVEACELLDFFKPVNEGVSVNKELSRCFGNIEVVLKELLDGEEGFVIEGINGSLLEYLFEEHLAQSGGELIDKAGNTEVIIGNDCPLGIKYLTDLEGNLRLFE